MYHCDTCGWHGENSELEHYYDYRGECHGQPAWEQMPCCPECGYDVESDGDDDGYDEQKDIRLLYL